VPYPAASQESFATWDLRIEYKYETYTIQYTFSQDRVQELEDEVFGEFDKVTAIFKGAELIYDKRE
jgi:hypothetical protein